MALDGRPADPQRGRHDPVRRGRRTARARPQAREVFDVTGAGDTVIATLAALVAAGMSCATPLPWPTAPAGIVVGKFGTATVSFEGLFA